MKIKTYTERFELLLSKEQLKIIREISKKLKTSDSQAIRICIFDYWEKI